MPSTLNIHDVVDFLERHNSLDLDSPELEPRNPTEPESFHELDYPTLFGTYDQLDEPEFDIDHDVVRDINAALDQEPRDQERVWRPHSEWHVCAWYRPIHYYGVNWGIFIREDCVLDDAVRIARLVNPIELSGLGQHPRLRASYAIRAALMSLYLHEYFHHKIESLGLRLHVATGHSKYLVYRLNVYMQFLGTDNCYEEGLANADSYSRLTESRIIKAVPKPYLNGLKKMLRAEFAAGVPGYRLADLLFHKSGNFRPTLHHSWMNNMQEQVNQGRFFQFPFGRSFGISGPQFPDWDVAPQMIRGLFPVHSNPPIWTAVPRGAVPQIGRASPALSATSTEMARICQDHGYEERSGTKHRKFKKYNCRTIHFARTGSLDNVEVINTLKSLGYRPADLDALKRKEYSAARLPVLP
jgi:hypothetical protein